MRESLTHSPNKIAYTCAPNTTGWEESTSYQQVTQALLQLPVPAEPLVMYVAGYVPPTENANKRMTTIWPKSYTSYCNVLHRLRKGSTGYFLLLDSSCRGMFPQQKQGKESLKTLIKA